MRIRLSAACLTLLAAAGFICGAAAKPPLLPLDQKVTCTEPQPPDGLQRIGIDFEAGGPGTVIWYGMPPPGVEVFPVPSPGYCRHRRDLLDCLLLGIHPATALLRTRLFVEFDGAGCRPVCVIGEGRVPAGAVVCGAAEAATGGLQPFAVARMCWGVMATAETKAASPAPGGVRMIGGVELDIDIPIVPAGYELLSLPPVEVELLPVPPTEVEPIPLMPVEIELQPFLPPLYEVGVPDGGTVTIGGGIRVRVPSSDPAAVPNRMMRPVVLVPLTPAPGPEVVPAVPPPPRPDAKGPPRNLKRETRARRLLAQAEHLFLDGEHDQACRRYGRVMQLAPGTDHAARAAEQLQHLLARQIIEQEVLQRAEELRGRAAVSGEQLPMNERVHGGIGEEPEPIPMPKEVCPIPYLAPVKHLRQSPQSVPPPCLPLLPPIDPGIVGTLEQLLTEQVRQLVSPRLIIEAEKAAGEEQERRPTITVPDPDADGAFKNLLIKVQETRTGSFLLGVGVNSDAGLSGSIILNERNFNRGTNGVPADQPEPKDGPGCPVLGRGLCIDIDSTPGGTRFRGQLQIGCLKLCVSHAGGNARVELSVTLPDQPDVHAEQVRQNERVLRWIESMNAGCLGGAEACTPADK